MSGFARSDPLRSWWCDDRLAGWSLARVQMTALALDIETTGLDVARDRITEIALVRIADGTVCHEWTACDVSPHAERRAAASARDRVARLPIVAHNARFDLAFLRSRWGEWGGSDTPMWLCTWRAFGAGPSLDALVRRAAVPVTGRHTAVGDAVGLARVLRAAWEVPGRSQFGVASAVQWASRLHAVADACSAADAVMTAFPVRVPVGVPTAAQRDAISAVRTACSDPIIDPVRLANVVGAARELGVLRAHVEPLLARAP